MMNQLIGMEEKVDKIRLPPLGETPWLVCTHGNSKHKQIQTFVSITTCSHNNNVTESYIKSIPQLRNKRIISSSLGWLILRDRDQDNILSLFNPITSQIINLPPLVGEPEDESISDLALTSPPDSDDDDCVLLVCYNDAALMFSCCLASSINWVKHRLELEDGRAVEVFNLFTLERVIYGRARAIMRDADGGGDDVHVRTQEMFYITIIKDDIDINSHSLTLRLLDIGMPEQRVSFIHDGARISMVESCGRIYYAALYAVFRGNDTYFIAAKVWELDLQGKTWVEVKTLDGRAFFLNCSGAWCWGTDTERHEIESTRAKGIQGNCLYFYANLGEEEESELLYSFNMLDQTWTVLSSFPNLVTPHGSPIWVMPPQNQRLLATEESKESIKAEDFSNKGGSCRRPQHNETPNTDISSLLCKLPFDIVEKIAEYMHLFEYWNFRASCKALHSALPARTRTTNELPLLMIFKNEGKPCILMDPCRLDSRFSTIPELYVNPLTLEFAKNGWLLNFEVEQSSLRLFNLFTTVTIENFPRLLIKNREDMELESYMGSAFSTNPTCPDCLMVAIYYRVDCLIFHNLRFGDKTWSEILFKHQDIEFCPSVRAPIFLQGGFHYLDKHGYLGVLNGLMDEQPTWQVYDPPSNIEMDEQSLYLVECEGELYLVFWEFLGKCPIQVFRFDRSSKKNWIEIEYLGNHILFISSLSSVSMVSKDPKIRNRIYLPRLKDKGIVFYSQDTRRYHTLCTDYSSQNLYGANLPAASTCFWI